MRNFIQHPENLGALLIVLGLACFVFRQRIAEYYAATEKERSAATAVQEFYEKVVKVSSVACLTLGILLAGITWILGRT